MQNGLRWESPLIIPLFSKANLILTFLQSCKKHIMILCQVFRKLQMAPLAQIPQTEKY